MAFYGVALFAAQVFPEALAEPARVLVNGPGRVALHWRWDAIYYYNLAVGGYTEPGTSAFFPLLPGLIRLVATILTHGHVPPAVPITAAGPAPLLAGIIIAQLAALATLWLMYTLAYEKSRNHEFAQRATLYLALFPLAFYLNVPYTEGVLLAFGLGAVVAARRRWWIVAGLLAGAASATRVAGAFFGPVLLAEMYDGWRIGQLGNWRKALAGLALAPSGPLVFMAFLWHRTGDPLAFAHVQETAWGHQQQLPWQTLNEGIFYLLHPAQSSAADIYARGLLHATITIIFLVISLCSLRWWRPSYTLYAVLTFWVILSSTWPADRVMHSLGRYSMLIFPVYLTLARWGKRPAIHTTILAIWLPLYAMLTALYVCWYPVS